MLSEKYAEPGFILPLNERFSSKMSLEAKQTMQENIKTIQANKEIWYALKQVVREGFLLCRANRPDAQLYSIGFRSDIERDWCCHWHTLNDAEQIQAIKQLPEGLLKTQATRLVWRKTLILTTIYINKISWQHCSNSLVIAGQVIIGVSKNTRGTGTKRHQKLREKSLDEEQLALLSELGG